MATNKGFVIWLTGLPGSGKTTIARLLLEKLKKKGVEAAHLESDEVRRILTPDPDYSRSERDWFYSVLLFLGKMLSDHGVNVLLDATANLRKYRDNVRAVVPRFVEVYVRCPLPVCAARDPKGIYAAARDEKATTVPGMQEPYEAPEHAEVEIDTDHVSADQAAQYVVDYIEAVGWIP